MSGNPYEAPKSGLEDAGSEKNLQKAFTHDWEGRRFIVRTRLRPERLWVVAQTGVIVDGDEHWTSGFQLKEKLSFTISHQGEDREVKLEQVSSSLLFISSITYRLLIDGELISECPVKIEGVFWGLLLGVPFWAVVSIGLIFFL